ncbi:MAG: hypothetical protein ACYDCK_03720 [Thermoplasmatota archaeon]
MSTAKVDWQADLRRGGIYHSFHAFDLIYYPSLHPAIPPEYHLPGIVGLTFRLRKRSHGGHLYVTTLDLAAVGRLGERIGLDFAASLAQVDSHERVHIALQLDGVDPAHEERFAHVVDAVLLSLVHPKAERAIVAGDFGVVLGVKPELWESLAEDALDV